MSMESPKSARETESFGSVAFVMFPELVDVVSGVLGTEHISRINAQIRELIQSRLGEALTDTDSVEPGGIYLYLVPTGNAAVTVLNHMVASFNEPLGIDRDGQVSFEQSPGAKQILVRAYAGVTGDVSGAPDVARHHARVSAHWAWRHGFNSRVQPYSEWGNLRHGSHVRAKQAVMAAVRNRNLAQVYQPQLAFETGEIVGLEALLRAPWSADADNEPDLPTNPGTIVELAEQGSMGDELVELTLNQVMDARAVIERLAPGSGVGVSLNIGAEQLVRMGSWLAEKLACKRDLKLTMEITEEASIYSDSMEALRRTIQTLREHGVCIAIDDFGVGFSNFARIRELAFDELKIDKALVRHLPDNASDLSMLHSTIEMAKRRGIRVTAEGVETLGQWNCLKQAGADVAQGFLMAKPRSLTDVAGRIQSQQRIMADPFR